jgi:hypothetical protein
MLSNITFIEQKAAAKKMPMKYKKHEMKESILPKVNCQLIVLLRSTQKEFHRESTV